jgi:cell fate regulator YaaT (PSP1 superfamily)
VVEIVASAPGAPRETDGAIKPIDRMATPRELAMQQCWKIKEAEALAKGRERALQLDLREIKLVRAEFSYDGARLTYLVSTPDENGRLDIKSLREDMQVAFPDSQVSMRPIGPRDAAKLIGGMGACGLEARCCCRFLIDFNPVSIKMAKEQSISLNPEEITGMCGRLRCCMAYEFEQYAEARKTLPKRNKQVMTPKGQGKVVDVNALKETIFVEIWDGEASRVIEVARGDFELIVPGMEAPKIEASKAEAPKVEAPQAEAPKAEVPKVEAPKNTGRAAGGGRPQSSRGGEGRRARRPRGERRNGADKPRAG